MAEYEKVRLPKFVLGRKFAKKEEKISVVSQSSVLFSSVNVRVLIYPVHCFEYFRVILKILCPYSKLNSFEGKASFLF